MLTVDGKNGKIYVSNKHSEYVINYFIMCHIHRIFFAAFIRNNTHYIKWSKCPLSIFNVPFSRPSQIESKLPSLLLASSSSAIYSREENFMNVYELDKFIVFTQTNKLFCMPSPDNKKYILLLSCGRLHKQKAKVIDYMWRFL